MDVHRKHVPAVGVGSEALCGHPRERIPLPEVLLVVERCKAPRDRKVVLRVLTSPAGWSSFGRIVVLERYPRR